MLNIMLLDDDRDMRELVSTILSKIQTLDCRVTGFDDFDSAYESLSSVNYDICLVDYSLNDAQQRTGIEFVRAALLIKPFLPIILLTGSGDYTTMLDSLEAGAVDFIEKTYIRPSVLAKAFHFTIRRARVLRELRALYQQVSLSNQIKSDVIRLAAHDIRSPLTTVRLSIDHLKRVNSDETQRRHIQRIDSATDRISEIVTGILTVDGGDEMEMFFDVDLFNLIHSVIKESRGQAQEKNQTINYDYPEKCPRVQGVPGQLREVAYNLINNAIKYTPEGGKIDIQLYENNSMLYVNVIDNGYGIPLNEQSSLFQPFSRVITDETRHIEGTGIGLYLIKRILDRHNGSVFFKSVHGKGSTFGFCLPIV